MYIVYVTTRSPSAPWQKAAAGRLITEMGNFSFKKCHFGDLEAPFWVPGTPFW